MDGSGTGVGRGRARDRSQVERFGTAGCIGSGSAQTYEIVDIVESARGSCRVLLGSIQLEYEAGFTNTGIRRRENAVSKTGK